MQSVLSPFGPFVKYAEMTLSVVCSLILTIAVVTYTSSIAFVTGDEMGIVYSKSLRMYIVRIIATAVHTLENTGIFGQTWSSFYHSDLD